MSKLNSIFNKIAKMEQNTNEVKLGKHEVQLSLIDDINEQYKIINIRKDEAFKALEQAQDKFKTVVDRCGLMESIAEKGIQMSKELGIDAKEFISWKNTAQENAKKFSKYLNLK
jgi:hypothetical protein